MWVWSHPLFPFVLFYPAPPALFGCGLELSARCFFVPPFFFANEKHKTPRTFLWVRTLSGLPFACVAGLLGLCFHLGIRKTVGTSLNRPSGKSWYLVHGLVLIDEDEVNQPKTPSMCPFGSCEFYGKRVALHNEGHQLQKWLLPSDWLCFPITPRSLWPGPLTSEAPSTEEALSNLQRVTWSAPCLSVQGKQKTMKHSTAGESSLSSAWPQPIPGVLPSLDQHENTPQQQLHLQQFHWRHWISGKVGARFKSTRAGTVKWCV